MTELVLRINGHEVSVDAEPSATLLDVLREDLGLRGVREGCGLGLCGACTVLLDGVPVSSCILLAAQCEGTAVVTIEGLAAPDGELAPLQQAFLEHNAFQCSYCTPGFILSATAFVDSDHPKTRAAAAEYLAGNLCRCGSYSKILDAVMSCCPDEHEGCCGG
jgi:xanthine dehydrogenase YagT iron-sulfur-binding subunit